jgi:hypothetical protein
MPAKKPRPQQKPKLDEDDIITTITGSDDYSYKYPPGSTVGGLSYSSPYSISIDPMAYTSTSITMPSSAWTTSSGTSSSYTITSNPTWGNVSIDTNGITMKEDADIKFGGKSLMETISKIEERLGILHPNPELENRWEALKALGNQYKELEKDLLEKEKIMKILKEK